MSVLDTHFPFLASRNTLVFLSAHTVRDFVDDVADTPIPLPIVIPAKTPMRIKTTADLPEKVLDKNEIFIDTIYFCQSTNYGP
jgi:hypothetical protein